MDEMVLNVQRYSNLRYDGVSGYNSIPETGKTGWTTMYALTRALQIELGIATPVISVMVQVQLTKHGAKCF